MGDARSAGIVPADIDWVRIRASVRAERSAEDCYAPHLDAILLGAFDAVRAQVEQIGDRPLSAPLLFAMPKPAHDGQTAADGSDRAARGDRRKAILFPVETILYHLLAAAAAPLIEPTIDRRRVFSAWPATNPDHGLLAPWSEVHVHRVAVSRSALSDPRWRTVVRLDVRDFSASIDRAAIRANFAALGLAPAWMAVADRLMAAFGETLGPRGLPQTPIGTYLLGTAALRGFDAWCADAGVSSIRVMDNITLLATDPDAARRLAERATARLGADGFVVNDAKTEIIDAATALARLDARDEVLSSRRVAAPDTLSLARALVRDFDDLGSRRHQLAEIALVALGRARDPAGVALVVERFVDSPTQARTFAHYLALFVGDPAVRTAFERRLLDGIETLHDWQWQWAMAVLAAAPAISSTMARLVRRTVEAPVSPVLRSAAVAVWSRFAPAPARAELDALAAGTDQPYLRAAIAHGCRWRPAAEARARLAAWSSDPLVALVAAAIAPDSAGAATADSTNGP